MTLSDPPSGAARRRGNTLPADPPIPLMNAEPCSMTARGTAGDRRPQGRDDAVTARDEDAPVLRIAALEDDEAQGQMLVDWLGAAGHRVHWYRNGRALIRDLKREQPELLLLDWEVPQMSGAEVLNWARTNLETRLPVVFVTNHDAEADIVRALTDGADDYLIKPLRRAELLARIAAVWRRYRREDAGAASVSFGAYTLRRAAREITFGGKTIGLTETEFDLAWLLFSNPGRLLTRDYLLEAVLGIAGDVHTRTMDTHISRLRRKLDLRPENGCRLVSIYGYGYRLTPAQEVAA